jgi:hypothetical protein
LRYVVIVAVSKYRSRKLDLPGVKTDSERLFQTLREHTALLDGMSEFPPAPSGRLADGRATWKNIQKALRDLQGLVRPEDQVILYFGGHGHFVDDKGQGTTRYYFLPHEATFSTATQKAIAMSDLAAEITPLTCRELVVIFDCCHSGGLANEALRPFLQGPLHQDLSKGHRNVFFMAAARGEEFAGEVDGQGGFHLQALCDGLAGQAQADPEGRISAQSAHNYAAGIVPRIAGGQRHQQSPVNNPVSEPIHLTRPAQVVRAKATLDLPIPVNPRFIGREAELDALHNLLMTRRQVGVHAMGLTGMGGMGKTALAARYAELHHEYHSQGVYWINAAEPLADEFARIGKYLRPTTANPAPGTLDNVARENQVQAAFDELRVRPEALLILDNLAEPEELHRRLYTNCTPAKLPCRLLFTTRKSWTGDFASIAVDVLPDDVALRLLLGHENRRPILDPAHPEHAEAVRITALLGCLPLALEQAAALLGVKKPGLALSTYRKALEDHGCIAHLKKDDRGLSLKLIHEKAVEATLLEQWDTLVDADDRHLMRVAGQLPEASVIPVARLGLLAGLSPKGDQGCLVSALEETLDRLALASLLRRLGDGVRLHPLVAEFARRQTPEQETAAFRRACAGRLSAAYDDFVMLEDQVADRGIDAVQGDLIAALDLCREPADAPA